MRRFGRPALIGLILALLFWLALMVGLGIRLTDEEPVGSTRFGLGPISLASGTVAGDRRDAGLDAAGYAVALLVAVAPTAITATRRKAPPSPTSIREP